jgi:NADP-dependent 3-hydroxy acid dehydrogenase YdfG
LLRTLVDQITDEGARARFVAGDLDENAFVDMLAADAGSVDILVNNAGILTYAPFLDLPPERMEAMVRTNLLAPMRLTQLIARGMAARGSGHVIMITSGAARTAVPLGSVYCATKHALSALGRVLRIELQGLGIRVSEVAPGTVETDIRQSSTHPAFLAKMKARRFTGLSAEDVAAAVVYVATTPEHVSPQLIEFKSRDAPPS